MLYLPYNLIILCSFLTKRAKLIRFNHFFWRQVNKTAKLIWTPADHILCWVTRDFEMSNRSQKMVLGSELFNSFALAPSDPNQKQSSPTWCKARVRPEPKSNLQARLWSRPRYSWSPLHFLHSFTSGCSQVCREPICLSLYFSIFVMSTGSRWVIILSPHLISLNYYGAIWEK